MPALIPPVLHPLVVHFVVALIPVAAVLATYLALRPSPWGRNFLLVLLVCTAVAAFAADQLGDSDLHKARRSLNSTARDVADTHEQLGSDTWLGTAGVALGAVVLRKKLDSGPWPWVLAIALWALTILLVVTAWYGGALTYEFGANTPR